jgi:hypothetical protein
MKSSCTRRKKERFDSSESLNTLGEAEGGATERVRAFNLLEKYFFQATPKGFDMSSRFTRNLVLLDEPAPFIDDFSHGVFDLGQQGRAGVFIQQDDFFEGGQIFANLEEQLQVSPFRQYQSGTAITQNMP